MNFSQPSSRQWVAIALGVSAAFALAALFTQVDISSRFHKPAEPPVVVTTGTVQAGDILATMLMAHGVQSQYELKIEKTLAKNLNPRFIQPGHTYEITASTTGVFQQLVYREDVTHSYTVTRSSTDVYSITEDVQKTVWLEKRVQTEIKEFLNRDLLRRGYDANFVDNLVTDLADNIFAWRIDFFTEQRVGDKLDVLMEQEYLLGSDVPLKGGKHMRILAATYTGHATKMKENVAIRYQAPEAKRPDYFDTEGNAVRRAFLRAPFTHGAFRISSGFNPHRFHPILRIYRPHHGTDYAAPIGTPVAAIGKGHVARAEWYKGYGKCVDIQHNGRYTSRYGHLSRILVRAGQSVEQGQRIGLVGNTGLATGPHLHFEMLVDGSQRNFLKMSFPAASAVAKANMPDFLRIKDEALARLVARSVAAPPKQISMNVVKE